MSKVSMLERFAAQSLVEYDGELIFSKEKFAELIVQECCDVLFDNEMGGYQVNYVLKEHFGVDR